MLPRVHVCGDGLATAKQPPITATLQIHVRPPRPPSVAPLPSSELPQHPSAPLLSDTRAVCALAYFPGMEVSSPRAGVTLPSFSSESWQRGQAPGKHTRRAVSTVKHGPGRVGYVTQSIFWDSEQACLECAVPLKG